MKPLGRKIVGNSLKISNIGIDGRLRSRYLWSEKKQRGRVRFIYGEYKNPFHEIVEVEGKDGEEMLFQKKSGKIYLLRKTTQGNAQRILSFPILEPLAEPLGYLKSSGENVYVLMEHGERGFCFDGKIPMKKINLKKLGKKERENLIYEIMAALAKVHKNGFLIGNCSLERIIIESNRIKFSDVRKTELIGKEFNRAVEELLEVLKDLRAKKIIKTTGDGWEAIASYFANNPKHCKFWYYGIEKKLAEEERIIQRISDELD